MRPSMSSRVGSGITFGQAVKPSGTGNVSWYRNTSDWRYEICMLHAASRALRPSSRQTSPFVIITLSLTYRPAGVASPIADLYASTCSFMSWTAATASGFLVRGWVPGCDPHRWMRPPSAVRLGDDVARRRREDGAVVGVRE